MSHAQFPWHLVWRQNLTLSEYIHFIRSRSLRLGSTICDLSGTETIACVLTVFPSHNTTSQCWGSYFETNCQATSYSKLKLQSSYSFEESYYIYATGQFIGQGYLRGLCCKQITYYYEKYLYMFILLISILYHLIIYNYIILIYKNVCVVCVNLF